MSKKHHKKHAAKHKAQRNKQAKQTPKQGVSRQVDQVKKPAKQQGTDIAAVKEQLLAEAKSSEQPARLLRSPLLKGLYKTLAELPNEKKAAFGKQLNQLKQQLQEVIAEAEAQRTEAALPPIDVTAPMDRNSAVPSLLDTRQGTMHPLRHEIATIGAIFERMGFAVEDSVEIDDQFHMFESLNFPKGHPARDEYDTFLLKETSDDGERLVAPAHTSTMQYRVLTKYQENLPKDEPIAVVVPDRVFRNEDVDARHEHTFYQIEGVYVGRGITVGNLIATLQEFLQEYYHKELRVRINPFYFPFTEPSFEFALSCPFCDGCDPSCKVCSGEGWIELLGCGMIHPNVLRRAGINPHKYTGFAFGCGIDRLVMMKYGIEDVRNFHSGKLQFLRQFRSGV